MRRIAQRPSGVTRTEATDVTDAGLEPVSQPTEPTSRKPRPAPQRPTPDTAGRDVARPTSRAIRWPLWCATRIVLPLILLVGVAFGVLYVRLLNGPVSLKIFEGPVTRAIAADLPGVSVTFDDMTAVLSDRRGVEFQLRNLRLANSSGMTIAEAPDAAVTLSGLALMAGRIAPARIILIEPSLLLQHSPQTGLSLSIVKPGQAASAAPVAPFAPGAILAPIAAAFEERGGTAGYLRGLGLRNATVLVDSAGQRATWRIREADVGIDRRRDGSRVAANIVVDGLRGAPWQATVFATRNAGEGLTNVEAQFSGLNPSLLTGNLPALAGLAVVDLPLSGRIRMRVGAAGEIAGGQAEIELGKGAIAPGFKGGGKLPIDGGLLKFGYDSEKRALFLSPSRIESGRGWMTLTGSLGARSNEAGKPWRLEVASVDGMLAPDEFGLEPKPLEAFRLFGWYDAASGVVDIEELSLKADGGEVSLSGHVPPRTAATRLALKGRMSPMSAEAMKLMWPPVIATAARKWTGQHVLQGRLTSGTFIVEDIGHGPDRGRASGDGIRVALALEGANVRIMPRPGFVPVEAPRVLIRLEGNTLDVSAPEAVVVTAPQRRLPLRGARMVSNDVGTPGAMGDLTFRAQGPLAPALDVAELQATRTGRTLSLPGEGIDGRIDAQVRIAVPLGDAVTAEDTRIDIRGRLTDGRLRGVFGGYDINGATLAVEISDQQLDAKGDLLLGGVSSKVTIKRIFAAPDSEQPPVLLTSTLDNADRAQLGLDVNEFVNGETPIEVLITPRAQGEPQIQVRANLTPAELIIEPLAWRKVPGRTASLQFEVVRPQRGRTELQGFRIFGQDISTSGSLILDGRNKLREFSFSELTLHVVSRLQVAGQLRADNVWDVTVRGQTLDGRDMFKALYALDQVRAKQPPPRKDHPGLELKAEIDNVLGHHDLSLRGLRMVMTNRAAKTVALTARGTIDGRPLDVVVSQAPREPRRFVARTDDAGQALRLIGFFPNMLGGAMQLDMNLDGEGNADKTGRMIVRSFAILGDPVAADTPGARRGERSRLDFDSMRADFELGHGQVVIKDADLRGQILGVVMNGWADFRGQRVLLGGTYVPLQGLNSAIGFFPILGQILAGPRGEGVIGMTFKVEGPMARPQMTVNPASIIPGILREMMQMTPQTHRITPRDAAPPAQAPASGKAPAAKPSPARASSTPSPSKGTGSGTTPGPMPRIDAEGGWSSNSVVPPVPQPARKQ